MARTPRLSRRFVERLQACGAVRGSPAYEAVMATIAWLCEAETLPGLLDVRTMMPPARDAFARRVAGQNLWIYYDVTGGFVDLLTIVRTPPIPT